MNGKIACNRGFSNCFVDGYGQIKKGDILVLQRKGNDKFIAQAKLIINPGKLTEEVIIGINKNIYFITRMMLEGTSWIQKIWRLNDVKINALINNSYIF